MISCTDFIPAYSELFRFIEHKGGTEAVTAFWEYISDTFLDNLRDHVERKGLRGCWDYWRHTLNEEAADFTMELDEEAGFFRIDLHRCPSKGRLLGETKIKPYHNYCLHCDTLYRRILEPLGYSYDIDFSGIDHAQCSVTIRKQTP